MFSIQQIENDEYEANARYDYLSEAYGATARSCNDFAEAEAAWEAEMHASDVAEYGPYLPLPFDMECPF